VTTAQSNHQVLEELPFDDRSDFEAARRPDRPGQAPELVVRNNEGDRVWDMTEYDFIDEDGENAPSTVNPSLWRQAALNNSHGLFEVKEGIYQLRGYDLSNMTIIEGDTGWILVDPLTARETASEAFRFAQQHLGDKPIRAILFTHSHIDHFGGVQGILQHLPRRRRRICGSSPRKDSRKRRPAKTSSRGRRWAGVPAPCMAVTWSGMNAATWDRALARARRSSPSALSHQRN